MSYLCQKCKKIGGHQLRFRDKACWKLPWLAHVIQHGLQGFMVKNIESESAEVNDLSHILSELGLLRK